MENKGVQKYVLIALFVILLYISFLILKPFITALLASFVLAYLFTPLYHKLNKLIKNSHLSSAIITILIVLIIILPMVFITNTIFKEAVVIYKSGALTAIADEIAEYAKEPYLADYISSGSIKIFNIIATAVTNFIMDIPSMLISFLITIVATFYLLMHGEHFIGEIKKAIPFKHKNEMIKHIGETTYSIAYGFFVIAIIEFILAAIGLSILKISSPFIWALLIGFSAMIPFIGPFIILLPLAIMQILNKSYYTAIGIAILYLILAYFENILRPRIIGERTKTHPVIIFIGTIGGLKLLGFIGIIIGPLTLSAMVVIIQNYYYMYIAD